MIQNKFDSLLINSFSETSKMGEAAASFVVKKLQKSINQRGAANLILATGASQFSFLDALKNKDLNWKNITVFHLDEYIGISPDHPASFRKYLHDRIIDDVNPGQAYFLQGDTNDLQAEITRYEELLRKHPADVACIGIGENGHLAFNDPPVADFDDPDLIKVVDLDEDSRQQQVGEGWFDKITDVPKQALSFTIPAIIQSQTISCVVPDKRKAEAVYKTLHNPISTDCPATILRTHPDAVLFLDRDSASML